MMTASQHPGQSDALGLDRCIEDDLRNIDRDQKHLRQVETELARDEARLEHDLRDQHPKPPSPPKHEHHVQLNYRALTLRGAKLTGWQIKEQAIAAGFGNIDLSFHLTVERVGNDIEHTVGDDEPWPIHDGDSFTAVKPDDNS